MSQPTIRRSSVYRVASQSKPRKIRYQNRHEVWVEKAGRALLDHKQQNIFDQIAFVEFDEEDAPEPVQSAPESEPVQEILPPDEHQVERRDTVTVAVAGCDGLKLDLSGFRDIRDYDKTVGRILDAMAAHLISREEATQLCWQLNSMRQAQLGGV
uniref:Uncharacterized protein n=1 Tax=Magnetococcus massalia (strain MO-1) TaxID=451514 RepID=A0A1S7LDW1_MAGMO|nr:Conserved protein of unknown function [Candidatus Magnetococcus massalia]